MAKKRSAKEEREHEVLLGLVRLYIQEGKPVGSNTLKESGFDSLSSATIRNYFADLEEKGYLQQQHASGGRIPTEKGYRAYADSVRDYKKVKKKPLERINELRKADTKEIAHLLEAGAEILADLTGMSVVVSAPRFDQDFIQSVKLVGIDSSRFLAVIISDFGVIQTEVLKTAKKLTTHALHRIEQYFNWRLTGLDKPDPVDSEEELYARKCFNEVVLRYVVSYSHFNDEDVYRTGFSQLLNYPEFSQATDVAKALSLFEDRTSLRHLLKDCAAHGGLSLWIGDDLTPYSPAEQCAFLAHPYTIHRTGAGAIGLLGSIRMPYEEIIGILRTFSEALSEALTKNVYKFKLTYRRPHEPSSLLIEQKETKLLEMK